MGTSFKRTGSLAGNGSFGTGGGTMPGSLSPDVGAGFDPRAAGQSLASILNNPNNRGGPVQANEQSWGGWLFTASAEHGQEVPPSLAPGVLPEVSRADFDPYLRSIGDRYSRFVDIKEHGSREQESKGPGSSAPEQDAKKTQGEGLLTCMQEIPSLYFDEDFALERGETFQAACPYASVPANMMLQEKLSHYLDLVEVHLVKEISARSDSFYEALGALEELYGKIIAANERVAILKSSVQQMDSGLIESARQVQKLRLRKNNLLKLHQKLKMVDHVHQSQATLRLLVASGDCSTALDVIDDMRKMLEGDDLVGLHCFRRLGEELDTAVESVNTVMAADFVRAAVHATGDLDPAAILDSFQNREKADESRTAVTEEKVNEQIASLRDSLLPLLVGLIRTARLPPVLRDYREVLVTDIKASIKVVVAEVLPIMWARPGNGEIVHEDGDEKGLTLAARLRALTAENFVKLLSAVFEIVEVRLIRAIEVKAVVEQVMAGLEDAPASAGSLNGSANKGEGGGSDGASKQFQIEVRRESSESIFAACDAAHGRWAKLLGVRVQVHPKLKLHEFVDIYTATHNFISATEKVGGRPGYAIRGTLQSQARDFVNAQHTSRMSKLTALLDAENWAAVDAPDEFQAIVDSWTRVEDEESQAETENGADPGPEARVGATEIGTASGTEPELPSANGESYANGTEQVNGTEQRNASKRGSEAESVPDDPGEQRTVDEPAAIDRTDEQQASAVERPDGGLSRQSSAGVLSPSPSEADVGTGPSETDTARAPLEPGTISRTPSETGMARPPSESGSLSRTPSESDMGPGQQADGPTGEGTAAGPAANGAARQEGSGADPAAAAAARLPPSATKRRPRSRVKPIVVRGQEFAAVQCSLMLLKILTEYLDVAKQLPSMATEVVHRVAEILKLFNSRSCQLVLGAGAMQVSGLKSITAKHLATASQSISLYIALIPDVRRLLSAHIPDARKALLLSEIDRVVNDYRVHRDEIDSKLVAIMRERLQVHLKSLPQIAEHWNKPDDRDEPSKFATDLAREVGILHKVLLPFLTDAELRSIFTRVVILFHTQLTEAFSKIDASTPPAKRRLYRDVKHLLEGISTLPIMASMAGKPKDLDTFMLHRFGNQPPP